MFDDFRALFNLNVVVKVLLVVVLVSPLAGMGVVNSDFLRIEGE
jgi:hypothetical protein